MGNLLTKWQCPLGTKCTCLRFVHMYIPLVKFATDSGFDSLARMHFLHIQSSHGNQKSSGKHTVRSHEFLNVENFKLFTRKKKLNFFMVRESNVNIKNERIGIIVIVYAVKRHSLHSQSFHRNKRPNEKHTIRSYIHELLRILNFSLGRRNLILQRESNKCSY